MFKHLSPKPLYLRAVPQHMHQLFLEGKKYTREEALTP
uniref:Uncharacterized protein n=1 Tax=Anguilla anguilla TaxID=7936 RepID=A0A0E9QKM0_ANGAN